ncbi:MAG: thioredoxin family protein [Ignavibacteriota bacterium]
MDLTLIIKDNCNACYRVEKALKEFSNRRNEVLLSIINIKDINNSKTEIVPSLYVNQKLYSYGDINEQKLVVYLNDQIEKGACKNKVCKSN